jgi:hypothetical protein
MLSKANERLLSEEEEEHALRVRKAPDAGHLQQHDEDAEPEVNIARHFSGEHGRGNPSLAKGDDENLLLFHHPIGNLPMKGGDEETHKQAQEFGRHKWNARREFRAAQSGKPPNPHKWCKETQVAENKSLSRSVWRSLASNVALMRED